MVKKALPSLCALSAIGETKAFYNTKSQAFDKAKVFYNSKSQAFGKAEAFYNVKSPTSGEVTTLSSVRPSGEVSSPSGTKFTAFKAKLVSCKLFLSKLRPLRPMLLIRSVASVTLTKLLAKQLLVVALNSKLFIRLRTHLGM